ncbi:hypothetical protein Fmac_017451 [Flemingia macrophylla]|uniref:Ninja-family protein n=1 Tax=Flemingia macrophylla TaxID=520843 RepID=A0ABD1M405_9FABA
MAQVEDPEQRISPPTTNFPRDLLRSFVGVKKAHHNLPLLPVEEVELSLGLSLNGRFGVDPTAKKIKRAASIPELLQDKGAAAVCAAPLARTCSLPAETEEEWRRRKELQTLRRMEARRKRSEKQRSLKAVREGAGEAPPLGRTVSLTTHVAGLALNGDAALTPPSPSSAGTQGTPPVDARSPTSVNLSSDSELKSPISSGAKVVENTESAAVTMMMRSQSNKHSPPQNRAKDIVRNLLEDMPSVSTKGEGPGGKKIEGFLYRYGKGEEVRIVCVCHGSFLTPSEFVKHAGGGEVANPLKHIVVSPSFL